MPLTTPDPLAEVRAEFAAGLRQRIDTLRTALERLRTEYSAPDAETLYRAAHCEPKQAPRRRRGPSGLPIPP